MLLRLPDLRRAGPEGRPGRRRPARRRPRTEPSTATTAPTPACAPSSRNTCPGMLGPEIYTKTCLYTLTPDRDFVVDRLPEAPNVLVALGAAHGYKFASRAGQGPGRARPRRRDPLGRRDRGLQDRPPDPPRGQSRDELDGVEEHPMRKPPRLRPGDTVGIVAPANPGRPGASSSGRSKALEALGSRRQARRRTSTTGTATWPAGTRTGPRTSTRCGATRRSGRSSASRAATAARGSSRSSTARRSPRTRRPSWATATSRPSTSPRRRWGDTISFYSNGALGVGAADVSEFSKQSLHRALFGDEPYGQIGPNPDDPG